jgi:hypothetical protein
VAQRVAQWLAQRIGAALQQVAAGAQAGAHAVWNEAVWQWLNCVVQQLAGRHRDGQSSSSSSSARADCATSTSMAASAPAVISRFNMVLLLVGSVSDPWETS